MGVTSIAARCHSESRLHARSRSHGSKRDDDGGDTGEKRQRHGVGGGGGRGRGGEWERRWRRIVCGMRDDHSQRWMLWIEGVGNWMDNAD